LDHGNTTSKTQPETPFANASAVRDIQTAALGSNSNSHEMSRNARPQVCPIAIEERVYDLGWRENWRRVLARSLFDRGATCRGSVVLKPLFIFGALVFC
jgi:hypothetical protein